MSEQSGPTETLLHNIVHLLDAIQYKYTNYTREEQIQTFQYAYSEAVKHFLQPHVFQTFNIPPEQLKSMLKTITNMVVDCWSKVPREVLSAITIHHCYSIILDDMEEDPHLLMTGFLSNMSGGKPPKHPWLRLAQDHLVHLTKYYGPFCALNIYRSTIDFLQGCWIEQHQFHGYRGCDEYPEFLRRLNGLGHSVGATLWPAEMFDEQKLFPEITTAICMVGVWITWLNDVFSFYKECDEGRDQISLVNNYCHVEGLDIPEALAKLTHNTLHLSQRIVFVFKDKDPLVSETVTAFMNGYITFHLTDERYRLRELYDRASEDDEIGRKFRRYFEEASRFSLPDLSDPLVSFGLESPSYSRQYESDTTSLRPDMHPVITGEREQHRGKQKPAKSMASSLGQCDVR